VNSAPIQVLLLAFVAAVSPVALGATLVVLGGRGGRWNALAFAVGVVAGQVFTCALAALLGNAALPVGHHAHETLRAVVELAFGIGLLVVGVVVWVRPPDAPPKPDSRTHLILQRLANLGLASVFIAGAVLSLGPKRLGLTLLAMATVAGSDAATVTQVTLVIVYVVVATALVTVPVVLAILFGARAEARLLSVEHWLSDHRRPMTVYPLTILGALVVVDAVFALAT
jgi:threonine/homoserine/homoserine lactone efflux protein